MRAIEDVARRDDERDGVVAEIGGDDDDEGQRALVARLRRAGERGERAPASLRARLTAILATRRGAP